MAQDDAFLGTGWSFPPSFTRAGGEVQVVSGAEDIEQSLAILLATRRGERVMQEDFGCDLSEFLFGEISEGLVGQLREFVADAILHHEPRIALNSVEVEQSDATAGLLLINIDYTVRATNSRFNMVYPFYINEAVPGELSVTDFVLIDGDTVMFLPNFGAAVVVVKPGKLAGSGPATAGGKNVCVDGDEKNVQVAACQYIAGQYSIPGTGTLSITQLAGDQKAQHTKTGGKPVLLKGGNFTAKFKPDPGPAAAKQPPPGPGSPIPDATPEYSGQGNFVTTNTKFSAT